MFARGLVSLHTPPLLGRKPSLVKSRVSISSKLIENKRFQVLYSGHLRKIGGRGSYRLVHTPPHLDRNSPPLSPIIPALARPSGKSNHSHTYAIPGGRGVWSYQSDSAFCSSSTSLVSQPPFPLSTPPCLLHHHSTPRLLRIPFPERNLSESRQFPGARPAGMSSFVYRCPDAHD